jgi:AraC-like DNA-binding protein
MHIPPSSQVAHRADIHGDVVPVKALQTLLKVVEAQGADVKLILKEVGIDFDPRDQSNAHINVVPTRSFSRLYRHLMQILQDEAFGMKGVGRSPPGTFRMMCLYIINCHNLQKALERCAEFFDFCDSFSGPIVERRQPISIDTDNNRAICRFYNDAKVPSTGNFNSDLSVLFMMYRFFSWMIGRALPLQSVNFLTSDDQYRNKCVSLFNAPIKFSCSENALVIELECLQTPIIQTETTLRAFLKNAPYQLITRAQSMDDNTLSSKIVAIVGHDFSREFPSAEEIAKLLNMSTRTLHRHLRKENTSFQTIKDTIRKQAAISYIMHPELTINAASLLMGFQDPSAFHRSFKKWTGLSPGEFRKQERNIYPTT